MKEQSVKDIEGLAKSQYLEEGIGNSSKNLKELEQIDDFYITMKDSVFQKDSVMQHSNCNDDDDLAYSNNGTQLFQSTFGIPNNSLGPNNRSQTHKRKESGSEKLCMSL